MIFVTLGTQDKHFKRLLEWAENLDIDEEMIFQTGSTDFETKKQNITIYKYLSQQDFEKYMKEARCIITHAGVGTILQGIRLGKKLIVVPRLKKYNEHVNDHQLQILETFSEEGYILPCTKEEDLRKLIDTDFKPKEFKSNRDNFNKKLNEKINDDN